MCQILVSKIYYSGQKLMRHVIIFHSESINNPKLPNSRVQSPTGIFWSRCLGSSSLQETDYFPCSNGVIYGSQKFTGKQGNRVRLWGAPISLFLIYIIGDVKVWHQSSEVKTSKWSEQDRATELWRQTFTLLNTYTQKSDIRVSSSVLGETFSLLL